MFSKALLIGLASAQNTAAGDICFGYSSCSSGCCLKNMDIDSPFYPNDYSREWSDGEVSAVANDIETL